MNNLNIPLYRAEVKDSKFHREDIEIFTELIDGKRYAIGLLCTKGRQIEVTKGDTTTFINIDNLTLAINFDDMLDSQGNKIFASLSKDRKGGDIFQYNNFTAYRELDNQTSTVVINQGRYVLLIGDNFHSLFAIQGKVIGIQK